MAAGDLNIIEKVQTDVMKMYLMFKGTPHAILFWKTWPIPDISRM